MKRIGLILMVLAGVGMVGGLMAAEKVRIPVRVTDKQGQPVWNLKSDNFTVLMDKEPVQVDFFLNTDAPVLIPLVFDTTGDLTYIDAMRQELTRFVDNLPPGIQLMVLTANDGLKVVQNNTADKELLKKAILNYSTKGYPGFMENLLGVAEYMNKLVLKTKIKICPIVITDSDIYKYRKQYTSADLNTEAERIKGKLQESFVPMFVLRLPAGGTDTLARNYEGLMRELARSTGGEAEFPMGLAGVSSALASTLHRIHGLYVVGWESDALKPGRTHWVDIQVVGRDGQELDAKVEYQSHFEIPK
jgi:VWFA-related protein